MNSQPPFTLFKIWIVSILLLLNACSEKENYLTWTSINVCHGIQGDAHLISKDNKHILIDVGAYNVANSTILPYLQEHNISEIDSIIITHPHFDHYGATMPILQSGIKVKHIYLNMPTPEQMKKEWWGGEYRHLTQIKESATQYGYTFAPVKKGDTFTFDKDNYIEVLYAYDGIDTPVGKTDINDMSVVAMIYSNKNAFLLTGDLNKKLSKYLAENATNLKASIVKFPHHGTESFAVNAFFDKVEAKVTLVPAHTPLWESNRSKRAREYVKKHKITTYVSGIDGHITVTSQKDGFSVHTQNGKKDFYAR